MFSELLKKNVKMLLGNKVLLFWTLAFPIILSTLFYFAFMRLDDVGAFEKVNVAVVAEAENPSFLAVMNAVSDLDGEAGEDDLFHAVTAEKEKAEQMLLEKKVDAVILVGEQVRLRISASGFDQTLTKVFLDDFNVTSAAIADLIRENPEQLNEIIQKVTAGAETLKAEAPSENMSQTVIYFYALLGMSCFYFAMAGIDAADVTQPNQSEVGARASLSSCSRAKVFLAAFLTRYAVCFLSSVIIVFYMMFVLGVGFSSRWYFVLLTTLLGSLLGMSFGLLLGTAISKKNSGLKIGLTIGVSMLLSCLTGLVNVDLVYIIYSAAPIVRYINPLGLISNSLYALYYYGDLSAYWMYMGIMACFAAALLIVSILLVRRKKYASI